MLRAETGMPDPGELYSLKTQSSVISGLGMARREMRASGTSPRST